MAEPNRVPCGCAAACAVHSLISLATLDAWGMPAMFRGFLQVRTSAENAEADVAALTRLGSASHTSPVIKAGRARAGRGRALLHSKRRR